MADSPLTLDIAHQPGLVQQTGWQQRLVKPFVGQGSMIKTDRQLIAAAINNWKRHNKGTQGQLAAKCGIRPNNFNEIVRGGRKTRLLSVISISAQLHGYIELGELVRILAPAAYALRPDVFVGGRSKVTKKEMVIATQDNTIKALKEKIWRLLNGITYPSTIPELEEMAAFLEKYVTEDMAAFLEKYVPKVAE